MARLLAACNDELTNTDINIGWSLIASYCCYFFVIITIETYVSYFASKYLCKIRKFNLLISKLFRLAEYR
jgi:hypothetical protein